MVMKFALIIVNLRYKFKYKTMVVALIIVNLKYKFKYKTMVVALIIVNLGGRKIGGGGWQWAASKGTIFSSN